MNVWLYRKLLPGQRERLAREFPQIVFRETLRAEDLAEDWADAIFGNPPAEAVRRLRKLRWLQIVSSGFDEYAALRDTPIAVTTAHGIHAAVIAQHVLGNLLWFARGQPHLSAQQRAHVWDRRPEIPCDLARQTIGLVGYGEIGRALARMLAPIGPRVIAVKRTSADCPPELHALLTLERFDELLEQSDHVVVTLPMTAETRGLIDARRLERMKRGAVLHNVARGGLVDEAALLARLTAGELGGAALDVFAREPLPPESPFWDLPSVVVTPHLAGHHRDLAHPTFERFVENLRRFAAGESLLHRADFARGY
jgi:phosphoglycerate dehydrogenase-like enzyme